MYCLFDKLPDHSDLHVLKYRLSTLQESLPAKASRKTDKPSLIKNYGNKLQEKCKQRNAESHKSTSSESKSASASTSSPKVLSLSKAKKIELMETAEEKVKTYLKPFFAREIISKEDYKKILGKCVQKVYERSKITPNILDEKVAKLVQAYVSQYA